MALVLNCTDKRLARDSYSGLQQYVPNAAEQKIQLGEEEDESILESNIFTFILLLLDELLYKSQF